MSAFEQAFELLKVVCARKYISAKIIQAELNVSRATAYRYMQTLQNVFSLEETGEGGVYRLQQDYTLNSKLKKHEKDFLDSVIQFYGKSLNTKVGSASLMTPNVIVGEEPITDTNVMENYEKLYQQIKKSCKCSFLYKENALPRVVEPYSLLYYKNSHYLFAKHANTVKTFRLDLIRDIKDTGEFYIIDEQITAEFKAKAKTIWYDTRKKPDNVVIAIGANTAHYFKNKQILPEQKVLNETEDGSITVSFQPSSFMEFQQLMLGWFGTFKVVEPKKYANYIDKMIETYQQQ